MTKIADKRAAESTKVEQPEFIPGVYRHWKGGLYRALFLVRDSLSKERLLVIYISMTNGEMFARPLYGEESSWSDDILIDHGKTAEWVPRFNLVEAMTPAGVVSSEVPPDGTA